MKQERGSHPSLRSHVLPTLLALALVLFASPALAQSTASAKAMACAGDVATVSGATDADLADVCAGVRSALGFLSLYGVRPTEPVAIEVTTTIQAKEYLAYVTMFSVMPAALRDQALRKVRTEGFATLDRFTPLLYSFDPMRFGAEAYRHFAAAADRHAVIQDLLAGTVMRD